MQAILQKWKLLIFSGIALVILAYTADPLFSFLIKAFHQASSTYKEFHPHWKLYTNHECGYVVAFPSRPVERPVTLKNKDNPVVVSYRQFYSTLGSNECFMVATLVTSFTNNFTDDEIDLLLDRAATGAVGVNDQLLSKKNITWRENPGREIEVKKDNQFYIIMRFYRLGQTLYELTVSESLAEQRSKNISIFMDSFSVISK